MANTNLRRDRRTPAGPPSLRGNSQNADAQQFKTSRRMTSRGNRVEPRGAGPGRGPTPDATIRQRVMNRQAEARENPGRGAGRDGNIDAETGVAGPPRRNRAVGTPPGQAAPPRGDSRYTPEQRAAWKARQEAKAAESEAQAASGQQQPGQPDPGQPPVPGQPTPAGPPKVGEERRPEPVEAQVAPGIPGGPKGPPTSEQVANQIAEPGSPELGPEEQDQVRETAKAEWASGQVPEPPVEIGQDGQIKPEPGMTPQAAADAIQSQGEAAMQQVPEPPLPKSPLGGESPIEQADAKGKLRAGTRHHLRAIGFQTSGMDPQTAKRFERQAVRDFDQFGEYPGMDDPHAPPPPIRPGKHSFNPMTAQWVQPEGQVSVLDRLAKVGPSGPPNDTVFTADAVRRGEVES